MVLESQSFEESSVSGEISKMNLSVLYHPFDILIENSQDWYANQTEILINSEFLPACIYANNAKKMIQSR